MFWVSNTRSADCRCTSAENKFSALRQVLQQKMRLHVPKGPPVGLYLCRIVCIFDR
nr:MAG TPA: hypothetical protein [Caudoviricetes sp.]